MNFTRLAKLIYFGLSFACAYLGDFSIDSVELLAQPAKKFITDRNLSRLHFKMTISPQLLKTYRLLE